MLAFLLENHKNPKNFCFFLNMGNTGFRKLLFPGELCETKYSNIFEFSLMDLDRNEIFLEKYKGTPCLIVNVASENKESAAQIEELKEIANKYQGKLQVLAFPSNQFGNEPQGFEQIKKIYFEQFKINFPLFAKVFFCFFFLVVF